MTQALAISSVQVAEPDIWGGREPRRWQAECLPILVDALRARKRAVVSAIMGAGKTSLTAALVATALPRSVGRAIVVAVPTQALVEQTATSLGGVIRLGEVGRYYADRKEPHRQVVVCCYPSLAQLHADLVEADRKVALLVVDELHKSEAEQIRAVIPALAPASQAGLTATPYRSLPKESLSLWDEVVYRYTLVDALQDGVLVPMRRVTWDGEGDGEVDEVVLDMVRRHARGPGIVSARDIGDAEAYATWLSDRGIRAAAIHSRLSTFDRQQRLGALEVGGYDCLVHVSLLAEGVDMPWLRWIGLRRPVQARVRFLQELGRVLRVHPGKEEGLVLDPHDLLGVHGLHHAEAIGAALEDAAERESRDVAEAGSRGETAEARAIAIDGLTRYLRALVLELQAASILEVRTISGSSWRSAAPSERQVSALGKMSRLTRHAPPEHREVLRVLVKHPWSLTRGQCSDLMDVLGGGARWCRAVAERRGTQPWWVQWPSVGIDLGAPDAREVQALLRSEART